MESLDLKKKKYLHTNSTSMPFYPMESILSRAWRHQQINKGHKDIESIATARNHLTNLSMVSYDCFCYR